MSVLRVLSLVSGMLIATLITTPAHARNQTVKVSGKFIVADRDATAAEVSLKLVDKDDNSFDDVMAKAKINEDGTFALEGSHDQLTTITPVLYAYVRLNGDQLPCSRKLQFAVPDRYINLAATYNLGVVQLEGTINTEGARECAVTD